MKRSLPSREAVDKGRLIAILSAHRDTVAGFVEGVAGVAGRLEAEIGGLAVRFLHFDLEAIKKPRFDADLRPADAVLLPVRFLDALSLDHLRAFHEALPSASVLPRALALGRDAGEAEFKISCPQCNQKLWIRDDDVGRKGRCPQCHQAIDLLAPADHVRAVLGLSPATPILHFMLGHALSCQAATGQLLDLIEVHRTRAKSKTIRVQIPGHERGG